MVGHVFHGHHVRGRGGGGEWGGVRTSERETRVLRLQISNETLCPLLCTCGGIKVCSGRVEKKENRRGEKLRGLSRLFRYIQALSSLNKLVEIAETNVIGPPSLPPHPTDALSSVRLPASHGGPLPQAPELAFLPLPSVPHQANCLAHQAAPPPHFSHRGHHWHQDHSATVRCGEALGGPEAEQGRHT